MDNTFSISREIISCDLFTMLPIESQLLFFYLCASANEDGIVRNVHTIEKIIDARETDLDMLERSGLVFRTEDELLKISYWKVHQGIEKCNIAEV